MKIHASRRTRLVVAVAVGGVLAVGATVAAVVLAQPSSAATTLGSAAGAKGRSFGVAVSAGQLGDGGAKSVLNREFATVLPADQLQWVTTERAQNAFGYAEADKAVDSAKSAKQRVRGSALLWPAQLPEWVQNLPTGDALHKAVNNHVTNLVSRYKGRVQTWDVVKEAYQDGSGGRRGSVLQQKLGNGYIEEAFKAARAADPEAKLCYSDYGIGSSTGAKTGAVYNMVKDFKARGIPIDCVAMQSRFSSANPVPATYRDAMGLFAALDVDVQVTDLEVEGAGAAQADGYTAAVKACLQVSRCTGLTLSGISGAAMLFDQGYHAKPAYDAVLGALTSTQPAAGSSASGTSASGAAAPASAAQPAAPCKVSYVMSKWANGLTANITIANTGNAPVEGWNLTFTLPGGTNITTGWNATYSPTSGAVTAKNQANNASIPVGGSVAIGFQGSATGDPTKPTDFALNGAACSAG